MGIGLVDGGIDVIDADGGVLVDVFGIADAACNDVDVSALEADVLMLMLVFFMVILMLLVQMLMVYVLVTKELLIWSSKSGTVSRIGFRFEEQIFCSRVGELL